MVMKAVAVRCRLSKRFLLSLALLFFTTSCMENEYQNNIQRRNAYASQEKTPLHVALSWKKGADSDMFYEGAELAFEEINNRGGVLGRPLKSFRIHGPKKRNAVVAMARELVEDEKLIAVLGHTTSSVAIVASILYEYNQVLFITPSATSTKLTGHNFNYTFRATPDNKEIARNAALFCVDEGWNKVAIIQTRDPYGEELGESFYKFAVDQNIRIISRKSFFRGTTELRDLIAKLRGLSFDAIFFGGIETDAARLMIQLREMGIDVPIIGGDGLDSPDLWSIAGKAANGTIVPTVLHPSHPDSITFSNNFFRKYAQRPTTWSAMGYDIAMLLAHGIEAGGSAVPTVMATTLRYMPSWKGVTGNYIFNLNGNIQGKKLYYKELNNGKFHFIPEE